MNPIVDLLNEIRGLLDEGPASTKAIRHRLNELEAGLLPEPWFRERPIRTVPPGKTHRRVLKILCERGPMRHTDLMRELPLNGGALCRCLQSTDWFAKASKDRQSPYMLTATGIAAAKAEGLRKPAAPRRSRSGRRASS